MGDFSFLWSSTLFFFLHLGSLPQGALDTSLDGGSSPAVRQGNGETLDEENEVTSPLNHLLLRF